MPGLNGIEVAQALDAEDRAAPVIVFVTAHDEFAIAAFDVSAADYLLKPVDRERFDRALERVEARLGAARESGLDPALRTVLEKLQAQRSYPRRFLVRATKGYYFVKTDDVEWVDAQGNYMRLHAGGKAHMVRATMKGFEQQLDPERFVRVHRSAIVAVDCVERIEPHEHGEYRVTLRDGTKLTSSRAHSEALRRLLR
jgi:two-component system LytT family response regulator